MYHEYLQRPVEANTHGSHNYDSMLSSYNLLELLAVRLVHPVLHPPPVDEGL